MQCWPLAASDASAAARWSRFLKLSDKEDVGPLATRQFSVKDQLRKNDPFKAGWKL